MRFVSLGVASFLGTCALTACAGNPVTSSSSQAALSENTSAAAASRDLSGASLDRPVLVFNHGDETSCGVGGFGVQYLGFAATILKGDVPTLFNCHAKLVSGTPVSKTIVFTQNSCMWNSVPAGVVNVICPHGG